MRIVVGIQLTVFKLFNANRGFVFPLRWLEVECRFAWTDHFQ
jgi:hypothetical protein